MIIIALLIFLIVCGTLAFYRTPPKIWLPVAGVSLLLCTLLARFNWFFLLLWLIFIAVAVTFTVTSFRLHFIMPKLLQIFQKAQPPISATEREALSAGDVWWEGDLFSGKPDWQKLASIPVPQLTAEEKSFIDNQTRQLCAMIDDWELVNTYADFPPHIWEFLKKEKFLGLVIAKEYGGHGFSAFAHSQIVSMIASRSASAGVAVMVPNALGTGEFIQHYGTQEQKTYYLPRLAAGIEIPAFALSSPVAGSDAASITDTGVVKYGEFNGQKVLGIELNWNKRYITLAPIATLLGLAFKMYDPEHLLGDKSDIGITACLVPTNLPGVEQGKRHYPAGLAFLNGPTRGKNVFIPLEFIIGGPEMRGRGWYILMECLAGGRGISLPAMGTGMAKLCFRMTGAYAQVREQFRIAIGQLEGVGAVLGRIGGLTYLCEALRCFTLSGIHGGVKPALPAAITKYHVTEMSRKIVNDAMDIHAGRGIQLGPRNYLGLMYQALPIGVTVEGANILTRNLMIFGQGAIRCHPYIKDEIEAAAEKDPQIRLSKFDSLFCQHIGYVANNFVRVLAYGLTGGLFISAPKNTILTPYYRQLTRMSAALSFVSDAVLGILGGTLKRKECISARLGDILSQLFMASAVIKYFKDHQEPEADLPFVEYTLQECLYQIQLAFSGLRDNFLPRWVAVILYHLIFPWGAAYRPPRDDLQLRIAEIMMTPSAQRDRICEYCFVGEAKDDPTGRVERAFLALAATASLRKKIQQAIAAGKLKKNKNFSHLVSAAQEAGILNASEVTLLEDCAKLQADAIQVDEFNFELEKE